MMRAVMSKAIIRTVIAHAKVIKIDRLNVEYLPDGWRIRAHDGSKIAVFETHVWAASLETYEISGEGQRACIPLGRLDEITSIFRSDLPITVEDDGDLFTLSSGKMRATVRQVAEFSKVVMPAIEPEETLMLETGGIDRLLQAPGNGVEVAITCSQEGFCISGIDKNTLEGMEYVDPTLVHEGTPIVSHFSRDYLVSAFHQLRGPLLMELRTDYPIKMVVKDPVTTTYMLAPLIHTDEEDP